MKLKITTLLILVLLSVYFGYAQTPNSPVGGGEFVFNAEKYPCLTDDQRTSIKEELKNNVDELQLQNKLATSIKGRRGSHPLFIWPIQKANGVTFNDVWSISGYVDHNVNFPDQLTDFNCGTQTYDTNDGYNHQGVDIYTWPFTWKLMDENSVEIIAAADGQIIAKNDGEFDRSCSFNNNVWNAIYVQHADGSVAWYGHMKNGSLSTKNIGDTVTQGEYLGIVGSSGNSTGPHLHFEVYTDVSYTQLVDPFAGTCNNMNTDSWWANQIPYTNSNINAVMTHSQAPDVFPTCPTTETTYESNEFDISEDIYLSAFLRDQIADTPLALKVIRPDGSYLYDWSINTTTTASSWYYYWFFSVDAVGAWTWEVTYEGQTVTHNFNVTNALSVEDETLENTSIYPNPFTDVVNINSKNKIMKASIINVLGKTVLKFEENTIVGIKALNLSHLSKGMYFIRLEGTNIETKIIKLIKK